MAKNDDQDDQQDDWAFKLGTSQSDQPESDDLMMDDSVFDDTKTSVRQLKAKLSRSGEKVKKKVVHKPLAVEHSSKSTKKSRRALARDLNPDTVYTSIYTQKYPTLMERMIASGLDFFLILGILFMCRFFTPTINKVMDDFLLVLSMIGEISPELVSQYAWLVAASILVLLFYSIPSVLYRSSFGKSVMSLYTGKESEVGRYASFFQSFMREFVFKPISLISVFGILMVFVSRERRSLHDRLSGTSVLKK